MGFSYIMFELVPPKSSKDDEGHLGVRRVMPFIFPDSIVHADAAEAIGKMAMPGLLRAKPVSAGSCNIVCVDVSGESTTLKLKSNPKDLQRITNLPYFHGIEDDDSE